MATFPQRPDRLHFVIASTQACWHGGESQAALLAAGLRNRRHECTIFARRGSEFARRLVAGGFHVETSAGRARAPWSLWHLRRRLRQCRPDVLFMNDPHALTAVGMAAYGLGIPVRLAARRVDFPLRSPAKYLAFADKIVCVSRVIRDVCLAGGIGGDRLVVIPDGADAAFTAAGDRQRGRKSLQLAADTRLLLVVAKLTDHKGHRYLLDALPMIVRQFPNLQLALAGDGELRTQLQSQAAELGMQAHVRFLGYRDDVSDLIAAADLIVQPSHMEGLCSSLIDAMLAARPIVATRAGGIPDLLDPHYLPDQLPSTFPARNAASNALPTQPLPVAWLTDIRSSDGLASNIVEALSDPAEQRRRATAARARALAYFTADQMVDRILHTVHADARQRILGA